MRCWALGTGLVLLVAFFFLMAPVTAIFAGLFLDEVAAQVEQRHYPARSAGHAPAGRSGHVHPALQFCAPRAGGEPRGAAAGLHRHWRHRAAAGQRLSAEPRVSSRWRPCATCRWRRPAAAQGKLARRCSWPALLPALLSLVPDRQPCRCRSSPRPISSTSSSRCGRLRPEAAEVGDQAAPAFRLARLADIAPVQDQPVMGVAHVGGGHDLQQLHFDLERRLARRQADAVAEPEEMRIDRDGRMRRRRCSAPHWRSCGRRRAGPPAPRGRRGTSPPCLSISACDRRDHVLRLVAVEADGLDVVPEPLLAQRQPSSAGVSATANSGPVALLTPSSVACADSTTATSKVKGLTDLQFALGLRIGRLEAAEDLFDVCGGLKPRCLGHEYPVHVLHIAVVRDAWNEAIRKPGRPCSRPTAPSRARASSWSWRSSPRSNLVVGGMFYAIGAWPVVGFIGLDVLLDLVGLPGQFRRCPQGRAHRRHRA